MRLRLALLAACAAALLVPAGAQAAAFAPGNKVFWGGIGGYEKSNIRDFTNQSGKHPAVYGFFVKMKRASPTSTGSASASSTRRP